LVRLLPVWLVILQPTNHTTDWTISPVRLEDAFGAPNTLVFAGGPLRFGMSRREATGYSQFFNPFCQSHHTQLRLSGTYHTPTLNYVWVEFKTVHLEWTTYPTKQLDKIHGTWDWKMSHRCTPPMLETSGREHTVLPEWHLNNVDNDHSAISCPKVELVQGECKLTPPYAIESSGWGRNVLPEWVTAELYGTWHE